jgi:hypothetical protein
MVCDTGPIIHLDELSSLDLLADFTVLVPDIVWQEVTRHRPTALEWLARRATRVTVSPPDETGI